MEATRIVEALRAHGVHYALWAIAMRIVESGVANLKQFARSAATLAVEPPALRGRS